MKPGIKLIQVIKNQVRKVDKMESRKENKKISIITPNLLTRDGEFIKAVVIGHKLSYVQTDRKVPKVTILGTLDGDAIYAMGFNVEGV